MSSLVIPKAALKLYRGTQYEEVKGRLKAPSWTPSLPVATIYSARPGDEFGRLKPRFLPTSTVHTAEIRAGSKVMSLCDGKRNYCSFSVLLDELQFGKPGGLTEEEGVRILRWLHRRWVAGVGLSGGPFSYKYLDEDGDPYDEDDVPFSLMDAHTVIDWYVIDDFEDDPKYAAGNFIVDTFALADSPTVVKVARRLGYDALLYEDVFSGGTTAAEVLLGCSVAKLDGVKMGHDLTMEKVPLHQTFRPLNKGAVVGEGSVPTAEILPEVSCKQPAANPWRRPGASASNLARILKF